MRRLLAGVLLFAAVAAQAQEGFPLDGTWRGQRQEGNAAPATVVMVIEWDGTAVTGVINPGPKSAKIKDVQLTPDGWKVNITAEGQGGQKVTLAGAIGELGAYHRHIEGTYTEGGRTWRIRMTRE
jgi:hypothetical protein